MKQRGPLNVSQTPPTILQHKQISQVRDVSPTCVQKNKNEWQPQKLPTTKMNGKMVIIIA
jgi:hypothetical protein